MLATSGVPQDSRLDVLAAIVEGQPEHGAARFALARLLWDAGAHSDSIRHVRILAGQHPRDDALAARLGLALLETGSWNEGLEILSSLQNVPEHPYLQEWRAEALWRTGRRAESIAALRAVIERKPGDSNLHFLLGTRLLASGAWNEGWPEFAWRWPVSNHLPMWRRPTDPLAQPDPASWRDRTVLVFAEQGNGDTLLVLRYLPAILSTGARLILEVQPALARLVRRIAPDATVVAVGQPVPAHDVAIPMLHLPWAFATTPTTIPGSTPYVAADPAAAALWRTRLAALAGLRVGLAWAGASYRLDPEAHAADKARSTTLAALAPLASVPGVSFVSLQVGDEAHQAAYPPAGMDLHDWTGELRDFADTADLMAALDLVITVDTAVVHLAGALGRPVWLLNRFDGCWRWLRDRDDSVWYPTLRQFTQTEPGDWTGVAARVADALAHATAHGRPAAPR